MVGIGLPAAYCGPLGDETYAHTCGGYWSNIYLGLVQYPRCRAQVNYGSGGIREATNQAMALFVMTEVPSGSVARHVPVPVSVDITSHTKWGLLKPKGEWDEDRFLVMHTAGMTKYNVCVASAAGEDT